MSERVATVAPADERGPAFEELLQAIKAAGFEVHKPMHGQRSYEVKR